MARSIPMTTQLIWGTLAVLALFFIGLVGLVITMVSTGRVSTEDLMDMVFVLRGDKTYAMSREDINDYKRLQKLEKENEKRKGDAEGNLRNRTTSAQALREALDIQKQNYDALQEQLKREKEAIRKLAADNKSLKDDLAKERSALAEKRIQDDKVDAAKVTEELRRTLVNMDAADIAAFLETYAETDMPAAVHYMQQYMRPDQRSEILTEMSAQGRLQFLQRLANKFADITPAKVAADWKNTGRPGPRERVHYLMQMPASQSLAVYLLLPPTAQKELAPFLLPKTR